MEHRLIAAELRHLRLVQGIVLAALASTVVLLTIILSWAVWVFLIMGDPSPAQREAVGPALVSGGLLLGTVAGGLTLALLHLQPEVVLLELERELLYEDARADAGAFELVVSRRSLI